MNFIFLRHSIYHQPSNVPSALLPHPITEEGKDQAIAGAEKILSVLKDIKQLPPFVECSLLLRAYQTAKIIAIEIKKRFGVDLPIVQTEQLTERKVGSMANLTVAEIEAIIVADPRYDMPPKGWKSQRDYKLPYLGCESLQEAGVRVANYIQNPPFDVPTMSKTVEDPALSPFRIIVGHGASFRHAAYEMGILTLEEISKLSMFYAEPLFFVEQSTGWEKMVGEWKVRTQKDQID